MAKIKKSQAALEFIMTYGWAIMVVLIAIGVLAQFGVLSPDRFLKNDCSLQAGVACLEHKVSLTSIQMRVKNLQGKDMINVVADAQDCGDSGSAVNIPNGDTYTFTITCGSSLGGTKYKGSFNITYGLQGSSITHMNNGELTSKIE